MLMGTRLLFGLRRTMCFTSFSRLLNSFVLERESSSGMLRNSAKTSRSARLNFSRDLLFTAGSLEGSKAVRIFLETGSARPRRPPMVLLNF